MFFILSKVLSFLINPIVWIATALAIALFLKNQQWKRRSLLVGVGLLLLFTNWPITNFVLSKWEAQTITVADITEPYDIGILLGGYSESHATRRNNPHFFYLSTYAGNRLTQTVELYKAGKIKQILLSGGTGSIVGEKIIEAEVAKAFLIRLGVPAKDIIIEIDSRNTHENALFSKKILTDLGQVTTPKLLLLTSAFHMPRAKKCFDKVGLKTTPFSIDEHAYPSALTPDDLVPDATCLIFWQLIIKEWIGIVVYRLKGYI